MKMVQATSKKQHSWPVRAVALLLILEAAIILGTAGWALSVDWGQEIKVIDVNAGTDKPPSYEFQAASLELAARVGAGIVIAISLAPVLISAVGVLFLLRPAWALAMLSQALIIAFGLIVYVNLQIDLLFPVMAYAIMLVFFLNSQRVRLGFQRRKQTVDSARTAPCGDEPA